MHPVTAKTVRHANSKALAHWRECSKAALFRLTAERRSTATAADGDVTSFVSPSAAAMIDSTSSGSCVDSPKRWSFVHITRPMMMRGPRRSST
jgi:hypothetical protein